MKDAGAQLGAEPGEDADAQNSHIETVPHGHGNGPGDAVSFSIGLGLGHVRQQQHRHGIGNGGRKENKRHGHAGENAVGFESLLGGQAGGGEPVGNPYGFRAAQQI